MTLVKRLTAMAFGGLIGAVLVFTGLSAPAKADLTTAIGADIVADLTEASFSATAGAANAEEADQPRYRKDRRRRRRIRRRRKRDFSASVYIGPDRFGLFLNQRDFRRYRGRPRRDYYYRGGFGGHRYDRRFARRGHWYVAPYYRGFIGRRCHPILKRGFYDGFRVLIRARRCYNRFGEPYIVRGSRRIVQYY